MEEVIEKMDKLINKYHTLSQLNPEHLNTLLQQLTSALYYLEGERAKIHDDWQKDVKANIDLGDSVSRAENRAHVKYPNMYRLRRVMYAGYKCVESIRSNLSYIKHEMNTVN